MHAKLSASGAHRWMACTPSANLEEQFPDKSSEYAEEGTLAHSLAELILRYNNNEISKKTYSTRLNKLKKDPLYSQEMQEYVEDYALQVWEQINEVKAACPDAQALFEQRLDFSDYVPEGFGTGDVVIIADDMLQIIDLKYGKGVGVSAIGNPQLRLYGLGAWLEHSMLYDIRRIRMTVVQPRLENVSTEELSIEELLDWAETEVKPRARLAMEGEGEFCVGDHCRFCKAFATCRAQKDHQMELAKYEFADSELLDDSEIGEVLSRVDALAKWAEAVKDYAFDQALNHGVHYDGWKLVEGRSNRRYIDDTRVAEVLQKAGYHEIYKPKELQGITAMEKLIGKKQFADLLDGLVEKPEGKPVLVPQTDKRPELDSAEKIKNEFNEL
ncbi:DUF2800 domain-containing protein [Cuneatibacter caecimuris]|uniref:Uncharacterized protein DUF2800 n=1 Tax=Cuneatibacter caecimuris TaxID=1796618 RepID=A0A4V2F8C4_9FIRM|nr:DUF2800 domain-containing protein [Cuneatibacter caecimuris]RZT02927.1 uncharacterized protein DUF2800 [Cuneatibacter caecimuris]